MHLKPTRVEHTYEIGNESGYRYTVAAQYDPETGWSAGVAMNSHGYKTAEDAVRQLRLSAQAFLRQTEGM